MKLLVFAHRGEAQIFLKNIPLKSHPRLNELYIGENESLLIVGEGIFDSMSKLSFALGLLTSVEEIINIGICGALTPSIELGSIHEVAHVYCEDEFKSFPCSSLSKSSTNCITAKERVLTTSKAGELNNIAPLVDRELWALCKVAKDFGRSIRSIKLVSDHIKEAAICEYIKENAEDYSDKLFHHYLTHFKDSSEELLSSNYKVFEDKNFYFTVSLKRSITNLIDSLLNKYPNLTEDTLLQDIKVEEIKSQDLLPKMRAKELEDSLKRKLYPLKYKINKALEDLKREINTQDMVIKFDESLERPGLNLSAQISSKEDFQIKMNRLEKFNWAKLNEIFEGKF
ncbi:phosphorylase [Bacteriovorax sp. Seq25_V]|uniref:phosphorylase n=1 Tax=Bacteriovorax sp. Seq25_V TaxID=1201288 RepID=UPI000389DCAA|nr:phosphorylase [Bacteriovorax sp. Seq25_V]EQC46558.1 phosphorylase domain protein [Bacteriovorax sp. Seq25_V]